MVFDPEPEHCVEESFKVCSALWFNKVVLHEVYKKCLSSVVHCDIIKCFCMLCNSGLQGLYSGSGSNSKNGI